MPVKNIRVPGSSSLMGKITGLTEEEKKIINDNIDKKDATSAFDLGTLQSSTGTITLDDEQMTQFEGAELVSLTFNDIKYIATKTIDVETNIVYLNAVQSEEDESGNLITSYFVLTIEKQDASTLHYSGNMRVDNILKINLEQYGLIFNDLLDIENENNGIKKGSLPEQLVDYISSYVFNFGNPRIIEFHGSLTFLNGEVPNVYVPCFVSNLRNFNFSLLAILPLIFNSRIATVNLVMDAPTFQFQSTLAPLANDLEFYEGKLYLKNSVPGTDVDNKFGQGIPFKTVAGQSLYGEGDIPVSGFKVVDYELQLDSNNSVILTDEQVNDFSSIIIAPINFPNDSGGARLVFIPIQYTDTEIIYTVLESFLFSLLYGTAALTKSTRTLQIAGLYGITSDVDGNKIKFIKTILGLLKPDEIEFKTINNQSLLGSGNIDTSQEIPTITVTSLEGTLSDEDYQKIVDNDFVKMHCQIDSFPSNLIVIATKSTYNTNNIAFTALLGRSAFLFGVMNSETKSYQLANVNFAIIDSSNQFQGLQTFEDGIKVDGTVGAEIGSVRLTETSLQELEQQAEKIPNLEQAISNISATATVDDTTGNPTVEVTKSGTQTAPSFQFAFKGLKGETGAQGQAGAQGPAGQNGTDGQDGKDALVCLSTFTASSPTTGTTLSATTEDFNRTPVANETFSILVNDIEASKTYFGIAKVATISGTNVSVQIDNVLNITGKQGLQGPAGESGYPTLPEDASTKTYVLKAVNGVLTWVEEINN